MHPFDDGDEADVDVARPWASRTPAWLEQLLREMVPGPNNRTFRLDVRKAFLGGTLAQLNDDRMGRQRLLATVTKYMNQGESDGKDHI